MENSEEEFLDDFDFNFDFFTMKLSSEEKLNKTDKIKEEKLNSIEIMKKQRRINTRIKRKEIRKKLTEENKKLKENMTEEERNNYYAYINKIKIEKEINLKRGLQSEYKIIFDLDYLNLMKSIEIKSLTCQLAHSYGLNKNLKNPFCFYITNFKDQVKQELQRMGVDHWHVKFSENKFYEIDEIINSGRSIIYLSPDSTEILKDVNTETIYVIGGFVDKPVSKNRSLYKANSLNIQTARLPLDEYINNLINPVLNINNVVEILAKYIDTQNWEKSIKECLPSRILK